MIVVVVGVVQMSDLKKHMVQRLCSARHWLVRAEESFEQEHSVRGELNLLLAQAELQRACEAKHSRSRSLLLHGLAVTCAAVLVVIGIGGSYWLIHAPVTTESPAAGIVNQHTPAAAPVPNEDADRTGSAMVSNRPAAPAIAGGDAPKTVGTPIRQQVEVVSVPATPSVTLPAQHPVLSTPEKQDLISTGDKQKLIREAGKTLRGN